MAHVFSWLQLNSSLQQVAEILSIWRLRKNFQKSRYAAWCNIWLLEHFYYQRFFFFKTIFFKNKFIMQVVQLHIPRTVLFLVLWDQAARTALLKMMQMNVHGALALNAVLISSSIISQTPLDNVCYGLVTVLTAKSKLWTIWSILDSDLMTNEMLSHLVRQRPRTFLLPRNIRFSVVVTTLSKLKVPDSAVSSATLRSMRVDF